ncbi:unnamed protein product [Victoria cruziana]
MMDLRFDTQDDKSGLQLIEKLTASADEVQRQVLREILTRNAETEYLQRFLSGQCDVDLFKGKVPLVNYEEIKPYIDRIADGEPSNLLCAEPISELLTSSGTSGGRPKMMPSTAKDLDRKTFLYDLLVPVMNQYIPGLDQGKGMYLLFIKPETRTPSGLIARPVLTSYYKSKNFRNRPFNKYNVYTSPDETILCPDNRQSMYCQLLCGLKQRSEVLRVGAVFASAFLRAIKFLEDNWREMCLDIRTGNLSDRITDPGCRESVTRILEQSDPELANLIETECCKKSWEGIIKRIWPRTKYVDVIVTGSMAQYIPSLEFYGGGLPLISTMYASSECYFGLNLRPLSKPSDVSYTLIPNMAHFEFLPVTKGHEGEIGSVHRNGFTSNSCSENDQNSKKKGAAVVDLVDVQIGHCYELIVTTFTGLYRYKVGDILMVTGYHNKAPQFKFVHRRNVVLSIDTDKTNEEDLMSAVARAKQLLEPLECMLTEYTSYADTSTIPGRYVLFWEIKHMGSNSAAWRELYSSVMEECCSVVEDSLDYVYRRCRVRDKSIGPLEIRVVQEGCFDSLMDLCVSQGSSVNQYKTPRCIRSRELLKLLDSRVLGRFLSQKLPVLPIAHQTS